MRHYYDEQQKQYVQAIKPQATLTATTTSAAIDTAALDCGSLAVVVNVGTVATADSSNYFTLKFTQGDTDTAGDAVSHDFAYIAYAASDPWDRKIDATTEENQIYTVKIQPTKRYIKLVLEETGTASAFATVTLISYRRDATVRG